MAWLNGETETARRCMTAAMPDPVQSSPTPVPDSPDDTPPQVFDKTTVAAEQTLWRVLRH